MRNNLIFVTFFAILILMGFIYCLGLMILYHGKLGHAFAFMKYLASTFSLSFLPKT